MLYSDLMVGDLMISDSTIQCILTVGNNMEVIVLKISHIYHHFGEIKNIGVVNGYKISKYWEVWRAGKRIF